MYKGLRGIDADVPNGLQSPAELNLDGIAIDDADTLASVTRA